MDNRLALLGGQKIIDKPMEAFSVPLVPKKAYKTINDMLDRGEISFSPATGEFEKRFARYIGAQYGLCAVNGTTSIQAALFAIGVKPGDEVIVPSFTFWATAGPVVACGAVPVFADADLDTQNITAQTIEKRITAKTRAVIVVHVWGSPCDMDPIIALAKKYGIKIVEDCSHAHGAEYKGKKVGSLGDIGCFSMQASKSLPAGEGGIFVTNSREYYERAIALGHYERLNDLDDSSPYKQYKITGFGFKHRMHPLATAIADANLDLLDERNQKRYEQAKYLEECLIGIADYILPQKECQGGKRIYTYHYARFDKDALRGISAVTLLTALAAEGVACGYCGYGLLHSEPLYSGNGPFGDGGALYSPNFHFNHPPVPSSELKNTEILRDTTILIAPRFEVDCKEDIELYAEAYKKVGANIDALVEYEERNNLRSKAVKTKGTSLNYFK